MGTRIAVAVAGVLIAASQPARRCEHRGANAQPGGRCPGAGTVPSMAASRSPRRPCGIDASRPRV